VPIDWVWEKGEKMPTTKEVDESRSPSKVLFTYGVDAVEVVRCKDCKKYIPCQKLPIGTSKWCDLFDRATCEMNYCGWAERKEDGETD
jgi:hypothetical protein